MEAILHPRPRKSRRPNPLLRRWNRKRMSRCCFPMLSITWPGMCRRRHLIRSLFLCGFLRPQRHVPASIGVARQPGQAVRLPPPLLRQERRKRFQRRQVRKRRPGRFLQLLCFLRQPWLLSRLLFRRLLLFQRSVGRYGMRYRQLQTVCPQHPRAIDAALRMPVAIVSQGISLRPSPDLTQPGRTQHGLTQSTLAKPGRTPAGRIRPTWTLPRLSPRAPARCRSFACANTLPLGLPKKLRCLPPFRLPTLRMRRLNRLTKMLPILYARRTGPERACGSQAP